MIYTITQGGPGIASETLYLYSYQVGFGFFKAGYGSALRQGTCSRPIPSFLYRMRGAERIMRPIWGRTRISTVCLAMGQRM